MFCVHIRMALIVLDQVIQKLRRVMPQDKSTFRCYANRRAFDLVVCVCVCSELLATVVGHAVRIQILCRRHLNIMYIGIYLG